MIPCGDIHHPVTVTDVQRSREFYTGLLGFEVVVEFAAARRPGCGRSVQGPVRRRGHGARQPDHGPAADGARGRPLPPGPGLDHLSFGVPARGDLEQAIRLFDERGVTHGEITRLPGFGIDVLSFEDPDGIQLELTAPVPADS